MLSECSVYCPWCGEPLDALIDASGGDCQYTEDCQVCCSPILITVRVDASGQIDSVDAEREN